MEESQKDEQRKRGEQRKGVERKKRGERELKVERDKDSERETVRAIVRQKREKERLKNKV